jgi:Tc toxin complex TcA C-terminal TcB-binding domain/ABC toxin N-terminal region
MNGNGAGSFTGRLVDAATGELLTGLRVRAIQPDDGTSRRIGEAQSGSDGQFSFPLSRFDAERGRFLKLRVDDAHGHVLAEEDVPVVGDVVEVALALVQPERSLGEAAKAAGIKVTPEVAEWLEKRNLDTLDDVRRAGGIAHFSKLPVSPKTAAVRMIDGLAAFATVPGELAAKAKLVRRGYSSIVDVARTPEETFVATVKDDVDADVARDLHRASSVQTGLLTNVLTHVRLTEDKSPLNTHINAVIPNACGCPACLNALSPMAYLADVEDYAVRHLLENGAPLTITRLAARFHQPFGSLPAACKTLDTPVHQVRIAVEVLRGHLAFTATPPWYPRLVYDAMLQRLGTSTAEVRDARLAPETVRASLAAGLGVPVNPGVAPTRSPDPLDLLFDPIAQNTLSEPVLEGLFGFRDTHRAPTDPDPLPSSQLYVWRSQWLRDTWLAQDWPASPPASMRPLIDPDQIDAADIADTAAPAYRLYDQRVTWIGLRLDAKRQDREQFGLDAMLQDLPVSGLAQSVSVTDLLKLKADKAAGNSIASQLAALDLGQAEFDRLAAIAELDQGGGSVLAEEWEELYSILVAIEKRRMFPTWRNEERTPATSIGPVPSGYFPMTLTGAYFRLRPSPLAGGLDWRPKQWRSDVEARSTWVATLRARIERETDLAASLRAVIDQAEEAALPGLRDFLVALAPLPGTLSRVDRLTRHLQIDMAAGACDVTTRIAQAIATTQGILFGARSGLLDDETIQLDAPEFDEEWQWIGSYATWRAAMQLFLYPELALQPALRRRRSPAFEELVRGLQAVDGSVDGDAARAAADGYAEYFDDVCSLETTGVRVSRGKVEPSTPAFFHGNVLAIARGRSGKLYMSNLGGRLKELFVGPPFLVSVDDQTFWRVIDPLPPGTDVVGLVPYRDGPGEERLAVYGQQVVDGVPHLMRTRFDGADWSRPAADVSELPGLARVTELQGVVPADPLADGPVAPWQIRANDWVVPADIDGDGRRELVVFTASAVQSAQRNVGVLRERDGTLVTSARITIPSGFTPFVPGGPVVLRVTRSSWPWQPERILLGNAAASGLALLGSTANAQLELLPLPTGPFGGFTLTFSGVIFAAADLDGDGDSELVIVDYLPPVDSPDEFGHLQPSTPTRVSVLTVTDTTLTLLDQETLPGQITGFTNPGIPDRWTGFVPITLANGGQGFLIRTLHQHFTGGGNPRVTDEWVGILAFNSLTNMVAPIELYPKDIAELGGSFHDWTAAEQLVPLQLGTPGSPGPGSEILITIPGATGTRVLARQASQAGSRYSSAWSSASEIPRPAGSAARPWTRQGGDRFFPVDLDGTGRPEIVVVSADGRAGVLTWSTTSQRLELKWAADGHVPAPGAGADTGWQLLPTDRYFSADIDGDGCDELVALSSDNRLGLLRGLARPNTALLAGTDKLRPQNVTLRTIEEKRTRSQLAARESAIAAAYQANANMPQNLPYLDEAFYFVPVELGLRLARDSAYEAALDWFASVYDYVRPVGTRKVAQKLVLEEQLAGLLVRAPDWLRDPLNPHAIAALRPNAYTRYTVVSIIRTLLAWADAEYTPETSESIPRAVELYLKSLELREAPELNQRLPGCSDIIDRVKIDVGEPEFAGLWGEIRSTLADVSDRAALTSAVKEIERLQASDRGSGEILAEARAVAAGAQSNGSQSFERVLEANTATLSASVAAALADDRIAEAMANGSNGSNGLGPMPLLAPPPNEIGDRPDEARDHFKGYLSQPSFMFCVTPNPDLSSLRTHAEVNLRKIRACRNIAGAATRLEPYAQPELDQSISDGRLPSPRLGIVQPLPYRYAVLAERAKQLVQLAVQIEASLLGTLERRDAAAYDELRARQDLALAEAGLRLKDLQLAQASEGLTAATIASRRADLQHARAQQLYNEAVIPAQIETTIAIIKVMAAIVAAIVATEGAAAGAVAGAIGSGVSSVGEAGGGLMKAISSGEAELDKLAHEIRVTALDAEIAETQARAALDGVLIATQDRAINAMKLDHAQAVAEFISRKFTGLPLYEWMSGVLQDVYRFFLQQAAAIARLAEAQLAFERQEIPPPFIQGDYWAPPSSLVAGGSTKGITGSERLLRDIFELDQYAFRTDQRKLQLSKTISLAQHHPLGFRRFQETGVMRFATPGRLFDRDFPGHFLRLIKRVRLAVMAPIPPEGIHATLTATGVSRVVHGPSFETVVVARGPESIALTSPNPSTGLFEVDSQPELLVPFEHLGVDTSWELSLPKAANQFDFDTIADVVLTIDYTALDSGVYREQLLAELDRHVSFQRMFSFRDELVDEWGRLHDPHAATPVRARFRSRRSDFAPHLDDVHIDHVTLYFSPASGTPPTSWQTDLAAQLSFAPDQGTAFQATASAQPVDGVITTLSGPGNTPLWTPLVSAPLAPFGDWVLEFASASGFASDELADMLFVVGYSGTLPRWPA